ncbi:ABC transporter substrate-binding protein [Natronomonas salina]|uniref:ABC transporter substrate-binding protein n=1 Tax=Natronomonas salina TaxID=1710540 RepID=UPI0015B763D2|nr:ABC transporter substrate-binding protein [Natronomonas salina]QLD89136.1 ABC transporter substrate-binding protein [Natronomonas salina]
MSENHNPRVEGHNRDVTRRSALKGLTALAGAGSISLAGCTEGGGDDDDSIKIGLQADLTGALSIYGFWHRRILENYVESINENDGIDGRQVELHVEDTETDSEAGGQVFRRLVQQEDVDFVIGSQSSGVSIATNPLAKQMQVPYFPLGEAPSITGSDGNRWVVRNNHSTEHAAEIAVEHGMDSGSRWTIIYQDYAFGQQYRDTVSAAVERRDGEVLTSIGVPVGESDLTSYLNKVPDDTEVLFNALIGASSLNFLQQSADLGTPGQRLGAIASIEGVDISQTGEGAQGAEYVTMLPREATNTDVDGVDRLREMADPSGTDNIYLGGHINASYEALSWIEDAVMETEWSGEDDNQAFIEWFEEGPSVEGGDRYPQGPKFFRGEDHQAFMDMHIERIEGGELVNATRVSVDEPTFEARANLAGQEF